MARDPLTQRVTARIGESQAPEQPAALLLDRYRVVESRATGGFARVDICVDTRLRRRVAIKRIPLSAISPETGLEHSLLTSTMEEALAEARTSSMLGHPNIVGVHDFESDEHEAYIVMEFVDGLNLNELMARVEGGQLTWEECAHICRSIGAALSFAHENGVLHLDIKPSNIMIDRSGCVKLADFGMAVLSSATGWQDARGGTVGYMPPEQLNGDLVDERSDLFSFAAVIWQALSGRAPFSEQTAERSLKEIERGCKYQLVKNDPGLDPEVEELLRGALEPTVLYRPSSIEELSEDLAELLGDAREGQLSLRSLMEQVAEEEDEAVVVRAAQVSLFERHSWLSPFAAKLVQGLSFAGLALQLSPNLTSFILQHGQSVSSDGSSYLVSLVLIIMLALFGALTPALGSALMGLMLVIVLGSGFELSANPAASLGCVIFVGAIWSLWWYYIGRLYKDSNLAMILPLALNFPETSIFLTGLSLSPLRAALSSMVTLILGLVLKAAASQGFGPAAILSIFSSMTTERLFYTALSLLVAGLGAALVSFIFERAHTTKTALVGASLSSMFFILAHFAVLTGVEKQEFWSAPSWIHPFVALLLVVLMATGCGFVGNSQSRVEV